MAEGALVLGVDPGFAALGFAVVLLPAALGGLPRVVNMGVFRTEKSDAKRKVLAADDNFRRTRELHQAVKGLIDAQRLLGTPLRAICAESMSFPRNASAAAKVAMTWGFFAALSNDLDLPVVQVSPMGVKKGVCGNGKATKEEVEEALNRRFEKDLAAEYLRGKIPAGLDEHAYDALGVVVASLDCEVLRMVRRLAG